LYRSMSTAFFNRDENWLLILGWCNRLYNIEKVYFTAMPWRILNFVKIISQRLCPQAFSANAKVRFWQVDHDFLKFMLCH